MIRENVLEIAVYYEQTSYKLVEQKESLSIIDLIATLGGTLGNLNNKFIFLFATVL